jgi:hypothetical protein
MLIHPSEIHLFWNEAKLTTLKLKTWQKQLLGCLALDIVLPIKGITAHHQKISSFCLMQIVYQNFNIAKLCPPGL